MRGRYILPMLPADVDNERWAIEVPACVADDAVLPPGVSRSLSRCLDTLHSHLWRPAGGALQTYGLKICPWPHPRHSWVQAFCRRWAKRRVRAVGRVSALSLSPATDGVPEPTLIIPDPGRNATGLAECHPSTRCPV